MNLTLLEYLRMRHPTINALTRAEAGVLGIVYPLQSGWIESYNQEIPYEVCMELTRGKGSAL